MEASCQRVETLLGPIELDILDHPETKARVVLLGDRHENKQKCEFKPRCGLPVYLYLQHLFEEYKGKEPLDFFFETPFAGLYRIEETYEQDEFNKIFEGAKVGQTLSELGFMHVTGIFFKKCLQSIKTQCDFYGKPIRFHYSDVRQGIIHQGMDNSDQEIIKEIRAIRQKVNEGALFTKRDVAFVVKIMQKVLDGDVAFFTKLTKIDKQFKKIKDPYIVEKLRNVIHQSFSNIRGVIESELEDMLEDLPPERHYIYRAISTLVFSVAMAPLVDVYILSRMFRHDMKRVIIFAGAEHTKKMKQFLIEHMGFKATSSETSESGNSFQCIDMRNVPQPWFT